MNEGDTVHIVKGSFLERVGLSVRGCVVIVTIGTVCGMSACGNKVDEPLYSLAGMILGYYFGQNQKNSFKTT